MKVVIDTNVFLSGLIFGGVPDMVVEAGIIGKFGICVSVQILYEIALKLKQKFGWTDEDIYAQTRNIGLASEIVNPSQVVRKITTDDPDNRILECALTAKVDYIITGDKKHLLPLKKFKGIPILSPRDFLLRVLYKMD